MAIALVVGCNNPSGGSSIATDHTPLLQPPGAFAFTSIQARNGDVTLRWSRSARVDSYAFFMGTSSTVITTPVAACSGSVITCQITGLDPNTVYYFTMTSTNAAGTKNISATGVALSVGTFDFTASSTGDGYVDLSWTNSNNATAYDVIYGTSSGSYPSKVSNVTSPYHLTGLTNNVRHYFRIVARNSQNGYNLSTTEVNEQPFGPPVAPTGVAIVPAPGQHTIHWNTTPGATSYKIYRGTVSGTLTQIATGVTTTNYIDTTVSDGTTYYYKVRGFNGYDSPDSAEVFARSISTFSVTSAVTGPAANQITVTWPAVTGAATYDVLYGTNPASLTLTSTNATSPLVLSSLTGNTPYYVKVVAKNAVGPGLSVTSLNQLSAIPVPAITPPTGVTIAATPSQIVLNWNAVSGATSYEVLRGTTTGGPYTSLAAGVTGTTYTDSTVSNGTAYYYVVRSFNGLSSVNSSQVAAKPVASFSISSATTVSSSSIQVTWGASAGSDAFDVQYGTVSGTYSTTLSGVTSPYSITGLSPNTTYYVVVRGRNAIGTGTAFVTAQASALTKTSAPSGLVATATPGNIDLDWSNTAGAATYNVYRGTTSGSYSLLAGGVTVSNYSDATAANGTPYYYVVTADNGSESANSSEVAAKPIAAFSSSTIAALSPSSIQVTWPATSGGDTFDVKYGTTSGTYTTTLTNKTSPLTITGLTGGTTYYVKVVAKNATGSGTTLNATNELSQTTPVGPPSGVVATVTTGQIAISWSAMIGASSYKIYRSTTSGTYGAALVTGVTGTSYTDTTTVDGTQYYYVVKSFNGADSADSAEVTGKNIAPFSLTSLSTPSTTSILVTFPATAGGDVYDVRYGTATGSYTTTVSAVTSPYTITGLTPNTTYYVVARARNTIGTGASEQTAEMSIKTPVAAPTGLAAVASPSSVSLSWTNVTGATNYNVYRGTTSGSTTLLSSGVTSPYVDATASNGTTYYYAVTAFNGSESAKSSEVAVQPIASHTISSVTSPSSTSLQVTWSGVSGATAYDVLYGTTSGTYSGTSLNQTSPYTITGLTANTTYYIVVRAKNAVGAGTMRNSTEVSQKTLTSTPTGLAATATSGQVGLNWTATTGAVTYSVYRGTTSGSLALLSGSVGTNAYLDTTVTNGTTYYYAVTATNAGGESAQSSEVAVRPIASFTITSAVPASSTSVDVTWPAAAGAATYDVRYGTSAGVYLTTVTGVTSPYTLTGLTANTTYYLAVRANNAVGAGTSLTTTEVSFKTATAAPTALVASSSASATTSLSWTAAAGATNYRVYRGTTSGTYSQIATGVTGTTYTDTTVTDGTTYFYVVRAFNGTESPNSNESSARSIANFSISGTTAPTSTTIQVTWGAATGAAAYDVKYGTTAGTYTTTVSGVTSPYTITGLASGTTYYIIVASRNAIGGAASNQTAEVSQITPLGPPTGLAAVASPSSVALSWTAAGGASSYKVYRGTTSGSYTLLASNVATTTYTDSTASNGTTYYYAVTAFNGADSAYSNEVSVQPIATPVISSVTSPTAASLTVTWAAATGAATYDVRYGTATGSYTTTVTNQTSPYTITGLTANTTYYIVVRANNAVGAGTTITSAESSKKTMTTAPVGLVASATPGTVGLNWTATTGATSYNVYRGTTSGSLTLLTSGVSSNAYADTTVANGTTYFYAVSADNGTESAQSAEVSVRPISSFSISSLVAASSTSFTVTWGAATGAAAYDVRYGTSTGVYLFTVSGATSPHTVTGLNPNTQYFVSVRARNAVGAGTNYDASEMNVTTATAAPTTLAATATTGQISLAWTAASGATNYNVYRSTTSGSYGVALATGVSGTTYVDTTVTNGTPYYYVVRSYNGSESPNSNEATGKSIANFSVGSTTAPTTSTIQVSWSAPAGGDAFDVRYGTTSGNYTTVTNVTSPYTITGLTANTTYYIVVRAKNAIGLGSTNQTAEVTQKTPTAAPAGLAATATPGSVSLTWTATTGASSYNVYRGTTSGSYSSIATGVSTNSYTDSTVTNGTQYYYVVTSVNGPESAYSNEATVKPIPNFSITSVTAVNTSTLDIVWPAVTGATAYDLKWGTATGNYTTTVSGVTSTYSLTGLSPGTTYYIVIVAKNAIGSGTSVQSGEGSSQTAFGAPGGVAVTATPGVATLSWLAVTGASTYKVFRSTTPGSYGAALATGLTGITYTDSTAANGTTYYYVVRAVTAGNVDSPDSSEVSIRPISTFTFTSATTASASAIDLTWTAATGAATYDLKYGTATGNYTSTVTSVTSPHNLTGLSANTTYYFQIVAKNAVGAGTTVNSSEQSAKTSTAAPSGLTASATPGSVALNWTATTGATNYNVYRSTSAGTYGAALATAVSGTTYTDSTVSNGTTYYYVIKANNGTLSANSNEVSIQPISSFSISATTAPTTSTIQVTWGAATGATTYDVRYGNSTGTYSTTVTGVTSPYTITGLSSATTYYIVVRANNAVGAGTSVQTAEATQITPLSAPTGLASTSTPGSVALSWSTVSGASSYKIFRSTTSGSYGAALATGVTGTTYTDSTVTNGTQYYYVIKAYNGADSANSNEATTLPMANFALTSVTAASATSLTVTWTGPTGSTAFDVKYGTATGSYTTTVANQTSPYTITGLTANTTYYVVVVAKNTIGSGSSVTSSESNRKTATAAPSGLAAVASPGSVALTWTATSGATSYKVYGGTTSGSLSLLNGSVGTNSYTDSTVSNGTTYYYAVVSNNGTDSAQSSEVSIQPISTFTFSSAVPTGSTTATLTWTAATGATSYDVEYGLAPGNYIGTIPNVTSPYTNNTLSPNTTYYARIKAKNAVGTGTSVNSSELSVKTSPANPTALTATATTSQVALSWTASTGATAYKIYRGTSTGSYSLLASPAGTGTTYTDSTAVNGTTYYYAVTSTNGTESGYSNEASGQPIASFAITSVVAASTTSLTVTWPATTGATAYDVRYGTATGSYTTTLTNQTSPYTITGLTSGSTYYVVVRAKNAVGAGANVQSAEVTGVTPLAAPSGLTATVTSGSIKLDWSAVSGASSYKVFRSTSSGTYGAALATGITGVTYTDSTPVNGTTYYYVVRSFNGSDSVNSSEVSGQPIASFSITLSGVSSTSLQVSWTNPAGGATYDVKYGTATGSYGTTVAGQTSPYTITGLTANQTYYVVVVAKNAIGSPTSTTSSESNLKTPTGAPAGLAVTATPGIASLTWSAVSGASSYKVYRTTTSGSGYTLINSPATNAYSDNTVANGTTYFYTVVANNGSDSAMSSEVSIRPISSFSLTAATTASSSSINLTWGTSTGAATYDVRYGTSTGVYLTTVSNVTSPYTLTGLTAGTRYYISIRAANAVGTGTQYDSNEMNALTAVGAPAISLVGTPGNVAVSWGAVSGATNYNVYRGTTSGTYSQIASAVSGTSYNDNTVTNGTTYYYVVRSYNGTESVNSNEGSIRTIANFTLSAATVNSASSITLTWAAATGGATYDVQYGAASGSYTTTLTNVTSPYTVTGLTAASLYYFSVRANNAVGSGTSNNSNEVTGRTATAAPTGLAATAGTGTVNLTWAATSGATNYNVYRGTSTGVYSLLTSAVSATNYSDNTVTNGTTYYYVIRAYNGAESANSNEAAVTPIGSFSISSTSASTTTIQVAWGAASGATAYDVKYGTTNGGPYGTTVSGQTSPYTITGLTSNTTYYIIITARNGAGGSVNSAQASQITALAAPVGLVATGGTSSVSLSWTAVSGASSYKVYRGTVSGSLTLLASGVTATTYADNTAANGTTYFYAVSAYNGADSANSAEVSKQPIAAPVISTVVGNSTTSVQVTWSAATGAATYDIQYGTTSGTYGTTVTGVTSPYTISSLTSGTTYYVRIAGKNAVGGGTTVYSTESSGAPNSPPVLSAIADQTTEVGVAIPIAFNLTDANNPPSCTGFMSASSSNTTVVPNGNIAFSGTAPSCTVTVTPAAGQVGTSAITITASDGITPVSRTFNVTTQPCTVASIVWTTQPVGMAAGNVFGTAPKVTLKKADGTNCTTNLDPVVLDIVDDNSVFQDAEITAGESVIPVGGVATFSAARMERAGTAYTVNATQGSVASVESSAFNVTALSASTIVWQQQPLSSVKTATMIPNPVLRTADVYGNYVSNGSSITVTVSLQNNEEGATLGGTLSKSSTSTYTYNNLTVNKVGNFILRATTTAFGGVTIDSDLFDVLVITNQDTTAVVDLLQGNPIIHSYASSTSTYYRRAATYFGTTYFDGTLSYELQIVATNTGTAAATVKFTSSTTAMATVTVPASTTTPTMFTTTTFSSVTSASSNIRLYVTGTYVNILSARVIVKQLGASKTQVQIPLTNLASTVPSISVPYAASTAASVQPNAAYFPSFYLDKSKIGRIDTAFLFITYKSASSTSTCASLWNKDTNTIIGAEKCGTGTSETGMAYQFTAPSVLPDGANIEARVRNNVSGKVTDIYKIFLVVRLVNITDMMNNVIISPAQTALAASTDYVGGRYKGVAGGYGILGLLNTYVTCYAKANTSGSGSFVLKTHGTNNSGTAGATTVAASTMNFTSQSTMTALQAGPLVTTDAARMYINYTHSSGNFDSGGCILRDEVAY